MNATSITRDRRVSARESAGPGARIAIWIMLFLAIAFWFPAAILIDYGILTSWF